MDTFLTITYSDVTTECHNKKSVAGISQKKWPIFLENAIDPFFASNYVTYNLTN